LPGVFLPGVFLAGVFLAVAFFLVTSFFAADVLEADAGLDDFVELFFFEEAEEVDFFLAAIKGDPWLRKR
jgi:hypothetical protein